MRTKAIKACLSKRIGKRRTIEIAIRRLVHRRSGIEPNVAELPHSDKKYGARDREPHYNVFVSICFSRGGTNL